MRIVTHEEIEQHFNENDLPFVFSKKYRKFIESFPKETYILFFSLKYNTLLPARKYMVKFFPLLQPLYAPVTLKGERLGLCEEKNNLNELVAFVSEQKLAIRIVQSTSDAIFNAVPDNSVYCPFGTYLIDLAGNSEEELFSKVHSRTRRYIKGMEKNKVTIKWGKETLGDLYLLYEDTMKRSNQYCTPLATIKEMLDCLENNILGGVAYWQDKPQGGLIVAYTQSSACSLYAGSTEKIENHGTMHFLYWEALRIMKNKNVRQFDCVGARLSDVSGTKLEGIQNFKEKLGGELKRGYLWEKDIDTLQCKIFDILLRTKHSLRGRKLYLDIIDQERNKDIPSDKQ